MANHDDEVLRAIAALSQEITAMRNTQLRMMKSISTLRHEMSHRLATTREELGALIKASHAELSTRFSEIDAFVDEQQQRFDDIERDFDALLDGHG